MDSNKFSREHSLEIIIEKDRYVLIPLCAFHKVDEKDAVKRWDTVENVFGLQDTFSTFNVYKIEDEKKWMLAKLKLEL